MDKNMNNLLRWSIENSDLPKEDPTSKTDRDATNGLNPDVLNALLGGPSDADLMREAIAAIKSSEVNLENKLIAFDNFEQLVENLDNANNMETLGLWQPLIDELDNEEGEMRMMAAWCLGTAVQNNEKSQEKLLSYDGLPKLVELATEDHSQAVRKKAILAISSGVRNFQPGLDEILKHLPDAHKPSGAVDATDMDAVSSIIQRLRDSSAQKA